MFEGQARLSFGAGSAPPHDAKPRAVGCLLVFLFTLGRPPNHSLPITACDKSRGTWTRGRRSRAIRRYFFGPGAPGFCSGGVGWGFTADGDPGPEPGFGACAGLRGSVPDLLGWDGMGVGLATLSSVCIKERDLP